MVLLRLSVRQHVPDFGSHRFKLRNGFRVEEIAIVVNDACPLLYLALDCRLSVS